MNKIVLCFLFSIVLLIAGIGATNAYFATVPDIKINKPVLVNDQSPQNINEQESVDSVISGYLEKKACSKVIDGTAFEAHELYGMETKEGKVYAYIWSRQQEYAYKDGKLIQGAGASMPLVIVLNKDSSGKYTVLNHIAPQDGAQYASSVKKLFPEKYQDKILSRMNANELEEIIKKKAENYFGLLKEESKNQSEIKLEQEVKNSENNKAKDGDIVKIIGEYVGQIDNSSVEIKINNDSGEKTAMAFRFSDDAKNQFDKLGLKTGDSVEIAYTRNGYDQLIIMSIKK